MARTLGARAGWLWRVGGCALALAATEAALVSTARAAQPGDAPLAAARGALDAAPSSVQELAPSVEPAPVEQGEAERPLGQRLARVGAFGGGQLALQYTGVVLIGPVNWRNYENSVTPSLAKFESNFERAPAFAPEEYGGGGLLGIAQSDGDPWTINVLGHGVQGSEFVLRMRREGFSPWQAALGGVLHSTLWEYGVEGWHETPSAWDLAWTPLAGAVLGELRHRVSSFAQQRDGHLGWRLVACASDPVGELDAWIERALFNRR